MRIDKFGVPCFSSDDVISALYQDKLDAVKNMFLEDSPEAKKFNEVTKELGLEGLQIHRESTASTSEFDEVLQSQWFMPNKYKRIDVRALCIERHPEYTDRINEEMNEFEERKLEPLLCFLVYLVDFMREEKIVWGVGRGSSVASMVLFIVGIHKINPIQYGLDWREFLR
jgi:DNA polymerase III alpha subunit